MPRHARFSTGALEDLLGQLRYAPVETRRRAILRILFCLLTVSLGVEDVRVERSRDGPRVDFRFDPRFRAPQTPSPGCLKCTRNGSENIVV